MRKTIFSIFIILFAFTTKAQNDSATIRKIYSEILSNSTAYTNLDYLCNKIGGRLAGSPQAQKAVEWAMQAMKASGADNVFLQECMVPHWVRGEKEKAYIVCDEWDSRSEPMDICALGGSIATPKDGINALVIEVKSLEEVYKLGKDKIKGKIVFYNRPFDNTEINPFHAYGKAVDQRWAGASVAAKFGAVASICRSMTPNIDDFPHTGGMGYLDSIPEKIPACAISTLDAERLSSLIKQGFGVHFSLKMSCETLPEEKSYNVVAEIKGSEFPNEIITVGGHLDAWDNGDGAHDDGSGVVQSIEVIRAFKALGIKPKRTIRAVAFMNEENGARGGRKYAELAKEKKEKHIFAIESDAGGTVPRGFGFEMEESKWNKIQKWKPLFTSYGADVFEPHGSGYDISFLKKELGTPVSELNPDPQRYFDWHHTSNDLFKHVNKRELELGAATMAAFIYLVSEYGL